MALAFLWIPACDPREVQDELNRFLASHRALAVDRHFIADGRNSAWSVAVDYGDGAAAPAAGDKARIDYREVLDPATFALLGRCRDGLPFLGVRVTPAGIFPCRRSRRRLVRKLGALEAAHAVGRIGSAELQARGGALVAALAHTRSLAWRRRKLSGRQEAR